MASIKGLLDFSDDDEDVKLEINKDYAQKYSTWREKEELQKLKTKYSEDVVDSSSSSEEEEDEDAEALTGAIDKRWMRALAAVRSNDPCIYEKDVKFFDSEEEEDNSGNGSRSEKKSTKKKTVEKPMYMKDFERKLITEKGGVLSENETDDNDDDQKKLQGPSYLEEQEAIKKSITSAVADMSSDDEEENILTKRVKSKKEQAEEEGEYIQFLKGEKQKEELKKDKDIAKELATLKDIYSQPDLSQDDKLLWNIVLDQGFRNKVKAKDEDWYAEQMAALEAEEETVGDQEEFENKYNFRFEEPDKDFLKSYERNPEDTVRQKDKKRTLKRQEVKERKKREKEKKQEEIRQLKNLKRKEILSKLEQLKEVTGNPDVAFSAKDIEEEFDPVAHDKMMQQHFGNDFYKEEELDKPQFDKDDDDDDLDDDEDWDAWTGASGSQQDGDEVGHAGYLGTVGNYAEAEQDFNMDADFDPSQASYTSGKKRKKSKFRQLMEKQKPTFEEVCDKYEGSDHPFGNYLDEYFKLDCEDIIAGDVKCRFRYRNTVPNDYGLTVEEVFKCPEKQLNAWASVKKIVQFRSEEDELFEVRKFKKAKTLRKKLNILPALKETSEDDATDDQELENGKQRKRPKSEDNETFNCSQDELSPKKIKGKNDTPDFEEENCAKKQKRKAKFSENSESTDVVSHKKKKKFKQSAENKPMNHNESVIKQKERKDQKSEHSLQSFEKSKRKMKHKKKNDKHKVVMSQALSEDSGKKKKKRKKLQKKMDSKISNRKGYQVGDMISSSRLLALGVDPRKFKYTKHRILHEPDQQQ